MMNILAITDIKLKFASFLIIAYAQQRVRR